MKKTDFLIIGAGPGGALTARELIRCSKDVILIESGDHLPLESCKPYSTLEMEQKYKYGGLNQHLIIQKFHLLKVDVLEAEVK